MIITPHRKKITTFPRCGCVAGAGAAGVLRLRASIFERFHACGRVAGASAEITRTICDTDYWSSRPT